MHDDVARVLSEIEREPSAFNKGLLTRRLQEVVVDLKAAGELSQLGDRDVDRIVALLRDRATAQPACMILTELGERALPAIPSIQAAIDAESGQEGIYVDRLRGCLRLIEHGES
jgi:hypothetical protein